MANQPTQAIVPSIQYEDIGAAVEFLTKAFGFVEREEERMVADDGRVWHAVVARGDSHVMLGTVPGFENPMRHGRVFSSLCVYVDDVDKHYGQALAAGAKILHEPADQFWGDRNYSAEDPAGHHWHFAKRMRAVERYEPSEADVKRHLG